jgi:hypothetical protein
MSFPAMSQGTSTLRLFSFFEEQIFLLCEQALYTSDYFQEISKMSAADVFEPPLSQGVA